MHERVLGRDARRDGLPHHPVDVAVVGDVLRVAVVRAERDPAGPNSSTSGSRSSRFRAIDASRIRSHIPARRRSRPSSTVSASWSEPMPAAAYACSSLPRTPGRVAVDVSSAVEAELLELCRESRR